MPVRASGSTSSRGVWRDPATATASCWLQRTTANAVEPCVSHACVLPGKCTKLAPGCLVPLQALARHRFALGRLLGAATPRLRRVAREVRHMQNRRPGEQPQRHQYQLAPVARGPGRTAPVGPGRQPPQAARTAAHEDRAQTARGSPSAQAWAAPATSPTRGACLSCNYQKLSTTGGTRAPIPKESSRT